VLGLLALLALVAVAAALWSLRSRSVADADAVSTSGGRLMSGACLAAVGVAVLGMVSAGTHVHAHGAGTADAAHAHDDATLAGGDHTHDDAAAPVHDDTAHAAPIGGADHAAAAHLAAAPAVSDPGALSAFPLI